jgi:DNA replication protein DnaC
MNVSRSRERVEPIKTDPETEARADEIHLEWWNSADEELRSDYRKCDPDLARTLCRLKARCEKAERARTGVTESERLSRLASLEKRMNDLNIPRDDKIRGPLRRGLTATEPVQMLNLAVQRRQERREKTGIALTMLLAGEKGAGKTCAMAGLVIQHTGGGTYFLDSRECPMRPLFGDANLDWWDKLYAVDLLVIDELGQEGTSRDALKLLIGRRHDNGRVTICAGNVSATEFAERYGAPSFADRLAAQQRDYGFPWFVPLAGPSMR